MTCSAESAYSPAPAKSTRNSAELMIPTGQLMMCSRTSECHRGDPGQDGNGLEKRCER